MVWRLDPRSPTHMACTNSHFETMSSLHNGQPWTFMQMRLSGCLDLTAADVPDSMALVITDYYHMSWRLGRVVEWLQRQPIKP